MDEEFGVREPGFIGNFLIYLPNRHVIFSNDRHLSPFALLSYEGGLPSRWPQGRGGGNTKRTIPRNKNRGGEGPKGRRGQRQRAPDGEKQEK